MTQSKFDGARSGQRRLSQTGQTVVESALVLIPFFAIIFAILDFSLAIFVKNVLYQCAREGVRYAVTQPTGGSGQDAAIIDKVQNSSFGLINASNRSDVTIQYYDQSGNPVNGVGSNQLGNICVINISGFPWFFGAPLGPSVSAPLRAASLTFSASSADAMGAPPLGILPPR